MGLTLETNIKYNEYINLIDEIYKDDENFELSCEDIIINLFENNGAFCENANIISVGVYDKTALVASAILVIPNNYQEAVLVCF